MKSYLEKLFIVEGIILGIIGILFLINPVRSLLAFTSIMGILIIIYSIMKVIRGWSTDSKFIYLIIGIIDILFGLILIMYPIATIENLILFFGIWALIRGIYNLIISIKFHRFGFNLETLYNVLCILVGLLIAVYPFVVLFALPYIPYVLGVYFIIVAVFEIYLGFKL